MTKFFYLAGTFLLACITVMLIFHYGDIPNRQANGFKRNYLRHAWSGAHEIRLTDTLFDLVGYTSGNIYVSLAKEGELLQISRRLPNTIKRIKIPFFEKFYDSLRFSSLAIKVDSPYIYLFAENKPAIVKTSFDSSLFDVRILPAGGFTREAMTGPDRIVLRKIDPAIHDQQFVRYSFSTGDLKKESDISTVNGDGGIITDGQLHFDAVTARLYYIYYYRNLLLSFDTTLRLVNNYHSIDTARSFTIKTGLVANNGATGFTNITPSHMINKENCVAGGLLFNMSGLKADNDPDTLFSNNSILDIIDLRTGNYLGSMHLPVVDGQKLSRFIVSDHRLIGLYTNSIVTYDLDTSLIQDNP